MRSVPIRQATPTLVPEREEREQRPTQRSPFRHMGIGVEKILVVCRNRRGLGDDRGDKA